MPPMVVTLNVSKLSGWLNADASCRETEGEGIRCRARCWSAGGKGAGDGGASTARCERPDYRLWGQGTGRSARRT